MALKKAGGLDFWWFKNLLGWGVLGDSLCTFGDGVLSQLSWQQKTDWGLDLARRDGWSTVVVAQLWGLVGDSLEDVVDKGVHDAHGLARDSSVRVDLLQDLVDVGGMVSFLLFLRCFLSVPLATAFLDPFDGVLTTFFPAISSLLFFLFISKLMIVFFFNRLLNKTIKF